MYVILPGRQRRPSSTARQGRLKSGSVLSMADVVVACSALLWQGYPVGEERLVDKP